MENGGVSNITIDELKHKLEQLSTLDRQLQVFGAKPYYGFGHEYKSHPMSEVELELFEAALGVRLPKDYRQFLQVIGYGAGPYYGLLGPKQILAELREYASEGPEPLWAPGRPFPFSREQAEECFRIMGEHRDGSLVGRTWPVDGCIPICFEGCSYYSLIITAGDLAGSIWSSSNEGLDDEFDELSNTFNYTYNRYRYNLAPPPPHIHLPGSTILAWESALSPEPTFLEWYNAWLDQCLLDFEQGKGNQPEQVPGILLELRKGNQPVKAPGGREFFWWLFWWFIAAGLIIAIMNTLSK